MAIHVNIGEAKARLSELIAASERGEEVIIARAGKPVVRFELLSDPDAVALRTTACGMWEGLVTDEEIEELLAPLTEEELALWYAPIFPDDEDVT